MIIYRGIRDEIHVYDSDFFDGQRDSDPLLDIVEGVVLAGYQGIFIHTKRLSTGEDFVGINFREDTPEGKIFSDIQTDFYQGRTAFQFPLQIEQHQLLLRQFEF